MLMKIDLSDYTWLYQSQTADSQVAMDALSKWIFAFGSMAWIISDRGAHFTTSVMKNLVKDAHISHRFTMAYCLSPNGTIEHSCSEELRACKVLISDESSPPNNGHQW